MTTSTFEHLLFSCEHRDCKRTTVYGHTHTTVDAELLQKKEKLTDTLYSGPVPECSSKLHKPSFVLKCLHIFM